MGAAPLMSVADTVPLAGLLGLVSAAGLLGLLVGLLSVPLLMDAAPTTAVLVSESQRSKKREEAAASFSTLVFSMRLRKSL
jgi:hypothetical protein